MIQGFICGFMQAGEVCQCGNQLCRWVQCRSRTANIWYAGCQYSPHIVWSQNLILYIAVVNKLELVCEKDNLFASAY